jgi:sugar phosphate isomerase/epimerase
MLTSGIAHGVEGHLQSANLVAFPMDAEIAPTLEALPSRISALSVGAWTFDVNGWAETEEALRSSRFDIECLHDPSRWPLEQQRLRDVIDLAARLGTPRVYGTTGPGGGLSFDSAVGALRDGLAPVLAYAKERGVSVSIENILSLRMNLSFVFSVTDLIDVCAEAGLGLCIDLTACWTERDIGKTLHRIAEQVHMVQVGDFVIGTSCASQRAVPGDGDIPLRAMVSALVTGGFTGLWDLELMGDRILAEGSATALARGWNVLDGLVTHASADRRTTAGKDTTPI